MCQKLVSMWKMFSLTSKAPQSLLRTMSSLIRRVSNLVSKCQVCFEKCSGRRENGMNLCLRSAEEKQPWRQHLEAPVYPIPIGRKWAASGLIYTLYFSTIDAISAIAGWQTSALQEVPREVIWLWWWRGSTATWRHLFGSESVYVRMWRCNKERVISVDIVVIRNWRWR